MRFTRLSRLESIGTTGPTDRSHDKSMRDPRLMAVLLRVHCTMYGIMHPDLPGPWPDLLFLSYFLFSVAIDLGSCR